MSAATEAIELLVDSDPLHDLIGTSDSPRELNLYPGIRSPETTVPAVVWHEISVVPENTLGGATSGIKSSRLQFDCIAATQRDARALANIVRAALVAGGPRFLPIDDGRGVHDDATGTFTVTLDFTIWTTGG